MNDAHASMLAMAAPLALTMMTLFKAALWLMLWRKLQHGYMLAMLVGWLLFCVYWSLIAISAGPSPVWPRGEIAVIVRLLGLGVAALLSAGAAGLLWCMRGRRAARPEPGENST